MTLSYYGLISVRVFLIMLAQFIYLICVLILVIHIYFRYSRAGRLMAQIPGPPELPLVGHMLKLYQQPVNLFKELRIWNRSYGKIYKLAGCHYRTVHLFDPNDIERLLSSTRYISKDMPYNFLYNWLGNGLLVSNGQKWKKRRKLLTPAFHFSILNKFIKIFCEQTQQLLDSLENEVDKNKTEVTSLISRFALRTMCETSMNTKISDKEPLVNKYLKTLHDFRSFVVWRLSMPWYYNDILYNISALSRKEKVLVPALRGLTKQLIEKRRDISIKNNVYLKQNHKNRPVMLDLLLDEEKNGTISRNGIQEEVDTFLFEGFDTTASAMTFMIMRLANEPEIQKLIYDELESIYGDSHREPTVEDLNKMKYLECCIKESLRLYPSVPFISRYVTEELTIGGYTIPKNTYYNLHIYDIHRNPEYYPDPEKFIPERFLPENSVNRHPYIYIPFSAGPRNCIGQKFALMEMKTLMSGLLRKFHIEPITKPEDLVFIADMILRVQDPIYVRFCHRERSC